MPVAGDHHHEVDFAHRQVNTGLGVEVIRHARWSARSAEVRVVRANRNRNFVDSLLEGTGFEPSVPLLRKALLGIANRRRRHDSQRHLQVETRDSDACIEWLLIAFPFPEGPEFESVFLPR